jgi:DNA-binding MarR family transcriptional regulator
VDLLMEASKLLTAVVARSLVDAHSSLSTPQLRILVMLHGRDDLNLTAVARGLGVNASSASRTCEQLVAGGLVTREEDRTDRRHLKLDLTAEGRSLVDRLMQHRREIFTQIVQGMPAPARAQLSKGLRSFVDSAVKLSDADEIAEAGMLRWLV